MQYEVRPPLPAPKYLPQNLWFRAGKVFLAEKCTQSVPKVPPTGIKMHLLSDAKW